MQMLRPPEVLIQLPSMGPDVGIFRCPPVMLNAARAGDPKVCQAARRRFQRKAPWDLISQHCNKSIGDSHFAEETVFLRDGVIFPEPHH